ncbi:Na+/H+ antiporter [Sphingosinicella sp. BN140058]|uniref:Na+/H+ antiporter n=1 Tax=Sphingosinicella sp. BN140058 TaxID=1892855 RepID=UPI0010119A9C|nr:Na+/H+ antiporter [Sphingosinicella sp. BN140058]QAY77110.1 Na+/H+ antiporter [Sphingosinicella sp. BN140058]
MHPVETFELVLILLAAVIALHWAALRLCLPPSAALLVGGGALAFLPGSPQIALDPELALVLFLPPLLWDGAYFTAFGRFRRHLPGILSLAVGAVLFTTLVVGAVVHLLVPQLPWAACFALGAIVSPPDAVSARAVLQRVTLPRRLQALLEGESLLNDATGLVLFRFAVVATLSGTFDAGAAAGSFVLLALGGAAIGVAVGMAGIFVVRRMQEQTLVVATSTLLCWGAYIAGEMVHVSGVIATVAAGLLFGWYQHVILPARVRLQGSAFWRTLVFSLEALVFILIGSSLRGVLDRIDGGDTVLATFAVPLLGIIAAVILARFAWVFASDALLTLLNKAGLKRARPLGWRQASVLGWTGMRGVVTLAVALTLPAQMPGRDLMLVAAFAVILVTIIIQGTSLGWLIRVVQPVDGDPAPPMALPAAESAVARAKREEVELRAFDGDGNLIHPQLLDSYRKRADATQRYADDADQFMAGIQSHFEVMLAAVAAGRAELIRLHREGRIEDEVLHDLERDLDLEEMGIIFQQGA